MSVMQPIRKVGPVKNKMVVRTFRCFPVFAADVVGEFFRSVRLAETLEKKRRMRWIQRMIVRNFMVVVREGDEPRRAWRILAFMDQPDGPRTRLVGSAAEAVAAGNRGRVRRSRLVGTPRSAFAEDGNVGRVIASHLQADSAAHEVGRHPVFGMGAIRAVAEGPLGLLARHLRGSSHGVFSGGEWV